MGLRDSWSQVNTSQGAFDLSGVTPQPKPDVQIVVGWVEDTLPSWLEGNPGSVALCHLDMDVYKPTQFVLQRVKPLLRPGSLIVFDELFGYPGWEHHEFCALTETFSPSEYEFVGFGAESALIRVL